MTSEASFFSRRPFRRRTWLRARLPWWLIDLGAACPRDGDDCEAAGDRHEWHNSDGRHSRCYHCGIEREGRLWKGAEPALVDFMQELDLPAVDRDRDEGRDGSRE